MKVARQEKTSAYASRCSRMARYEGEKLTLKRQEVIHYQKQAEGGVVRCRIEVFDDSAYVDGDEIEIIFEFCSDPAAKAIAHVESLGYARSL